MRKTLVILFLAAMGAALLIGCGDENLVPYFTQWNASVNCGVAPLLVQFTARASGGDPLDNPTTANTPLDIIWDFQDGGTATGSLVYHSFAEPGEYHVALTVKDKDGDGETQHIMINIMTDSLTVVAVPLGDGVEPDTTVAVGDTVQFNLYARTCGFDTDTGNYESQFLFTWRMGNSLNTVYHGRAPRFTYGLADVGLRRATVSVLDDQASVVRRDTVTVQVTAK